MAEAIWRAMGHEAVGSAGVSAWPGQKAASHAGTAVERYGGTLENHRSRDLDDVSEEPDLVLTMTAAQKERVLVRRPEWAERTWVLTEMVGETGDITDPIGQDLTAYQAVADQLHRLLTQFRDKLAKGLDG